MIGGRPSGTRAALWWAHKGRTDPTYGLGLSAEQGRAALASAPADAWQRPLLAELVEALEAGPVPADLWERIAEAIAADAPDGWVRCTRCNTTRKGTVTWCLCDFNGGCDV